MRGTKLDFVFSFILRIHVATTTSKVAYRGLKFARLSTLVVHVEVVFTSRRPTK